jgi:hypothetical protein
VSGGLSQAELEEQEQIDGGAERVRAAMELAQPVETFQGQGKTGQEPDKQQALAIGSKPCIGPPPTSVFRIMM